MSMFKMTMTLATIASVVAGEQTRIVESAPQSSAHPDFVGEVLCTVRSNGEIVAETPCELGDMATLEELTMFYARSFNGVEVAQSLASTETKHARYFEVTYGSKVYTVKSTASSQEEAFDKVSNLVRKHQANHCIELEGGFGFGEQFTVSYLGEAKPSKSITLVHLRSELPKSKPDCLEKYKAFEKEFNKPFSERLRDLLDS